MICNQNTADVLPIKKLVAPTSVGATSLNAVAQGFEPWVAVTPHSISSAAPSAARTRYLTRILYYMDPHRAQIDREVWDQGHTTSQDHTAARNTGTTSAFRTVENTIK